MERRFIGIKDLAIYLGLSQNTIRKWVGQGRIPFIKFGKALRFDLKRIDTWANEKECAYVRKHFD